MNLKDLIREKRVKDMSQVGELVDKNVEIRRVSKVVKGGRRFSFSALVITGDSNGHVGYGTGKANEVPEALRKASEEAKRNLVKVPTRDNTIPHDIIGVFGNTTVLLKPASDGTGVIAGSVVRMVVESAGIKDIRTKCLNNTSKNNILLATLQGLLNLSDPEVVSKMRGTSLDEIGYAPY